MDHKLRAGEEKKIHGEVEMSTKIRLREKSREDSE